MIGMAVLGLAFVFFLVIAFLAAKGWQIGHLIAFCFLFLFALVFFYLTNQTLQVRSKFMREFTEADTGLDQELQKKSEFLTGSLIDPERAMQTVDGANQAVKLEIRDRGRVWRNLVALAGDQDTLTLGTRAWTNDGCLRVGQEPAPEEVIEPVVDPAMNEPADEATAAPDAAAAGETTADAATTEAAETAATAEGAGDETVAPPAGAIAPAPVPGQPAAGQGPAHGIPENAFVYLFKEYPIALLSPAEQELYFGAGEDRLSTQDRQGLCRVPLVYVGKFKVAQSGADVVTLEWTTPLEMRPRFPANPRDPATWVIYEKLPIDAPEIRRGKSLDELRAVFSPQRMAQLAGIQLNPQLYDSMLQEMVQDGQTAQGNLPPEVSAVTVEFLQPYEVVVDLSVEGPLPEVDRAFGADGRAQVAPLLQGEPTKFIAGETAEFDAVTAGGLINRGIAKAVEVKFQRPLRDFDQFFQATELELLRLKDRILVYEHDNSELKKSAESVQKQIEQLHTEQGKLAADHAGFQREIEALQQYAGLLQTRYNSLTRRLSTLVPIGP